MVPVTLFRAKPSLPFLNRPLLARALDGLAAHGVTEVVVNVHHRPESLLPLLAERPGLGLRVSRETELLGTSGGLARAADAFRGGGTFLCVNSDVVTDIDFRAGTLLTRNVLEAAKAAANWVLGAVRAKMNDEGIGSAVGVRAVLPAEHLAGLLTLVDNGTLSGSMAKDVFERMFASGRRAEDIVEAEGLAQVDDESLLGDLVVGVLGAHADAVAQYRGGKTTAFGFLVGQVMKAADGKANPRRVNELLRKALASG